MRKKTTEEFISDSIAVHDNKYDYSKVEYVDHKTKVCIICPIHGEFWQTPIAHLQGQGCSECGRIRTNESKSYTKESFIEKAKKIHGEHKYDYSEVEYIGCTIPVKIICPIHGPFYQQPTLHLSGRGCARCNASGVRRKVLFGIAVVDVSDAHSPENRKAYTIWIDMLNRCYDPQMLLRYPTYQGCFVCDEWLLFSRFLEWFKENYREGYDLDKDILIKGNKVYSPTTSCFVPHKLNCAFLKSQAKRGNCPIGVHYDSERQKYVASMRRDMQTKFLGRFNTKEDAFKTYKVAKEQYIKELAESYFKEGKITERIYQALMKYEVEITD